MPDPLGRYSANRLFEWVAAVAMLNTGIVLLIWPSTLPHGNLRYLLDLAGPRELTAVCLVIGLLRGITLTLNGALDVWGARMRAIMASISAIVWMEMTAALYLQLGEPSVSSGILIALTLGELRSVARARRDLHGV